MARPTLAFQQSPFLSVQRSVHGPPREAGIDTGSRVFVKRQEAGSYRGVACAPPTLTSSARPVAPATASHRKPEEVTAADVPHVPHVAHVAHVAHGAHEAHEAHRAQKAHGQNVETEVRRIVKHICPSCRRSFETNEDVRAHWLEEHHEAKSPGCGKDPSSKSTVDRPQSGPSPESPPPSPAESPESPEIADAEADADLDTMRAKIVEVDEGGRPVIVRQQDSQAPGGVRTIITQQDGKCCAFGEAIVASLLAQEEAKATAWVSSMDARSLRGLVNELSERFFDAQRHLSHCKAELEEKRRKRGLSLFNLPGDCTEKDLETAYRRLARSMHPDKNGGTEEAKEQFQIMRASYEDLKEQFEQGQIGKTPKETTRDAPESPETSQDPPDVSAEDAGESPESPRDSAKAEASCTNQKSGEPDSSGPPQNSNQETIFYSRSEDLVELQRAVRKIVEKMKVLQQNIAMVERDLGYAAEAPSVN